jgi:hypothetical protein
MLENSASMQVRWTSDEASGLLVPVRCPPAYDCVSESDYVDNFRTFTKIAWSGVSPLDPPTAGLEEPIIVLSVEEGRCTSVVDWQLLLRRQLRAV